MKLLVLKFLSLGMSGYLWIARRLDYYFNKSVYTLAKADASTDPYLAANAIRERAPVIRSYMNNGWIITGYNEVTDILREPRITGDIASNKFVTRIVRFAAEGHKVLSVDYPTMLSQDAPDHTRLRKLVARGFVHKYIQSLAPTIGRLVDDLLDDIPNPEHFDVMHTLAKPLPAIVIAEMMGVPVAERHLFEEWSEDLLKGSDLAHPELIKQGGIATAEMRTYLAELTEQKRKNPGQDLLSQLIEAEEDGDKLTIEELYSNCILLLVAGHETTTRLIGSCLHLLLKHPKQMCAARESEVLLMGAIEESLRFEPPVQFTARVVKENFEFKGIELKQDQLLMLSLAAANRDPQINERPDEFDITREKSTHVSFGYGIHLCLGMSLARLEAKIVFEKLFEKFSDLENAQGNLDWGQNPMFRGLEQLHVRTTGATEFSESIPLAKTATIS
jgi:cytochrome P450